MCARRSQWTPPQPRSARNPGDNLDVVRLDRQSLDNLPIFDQDYIGTMSRFLDACAIGTGGVTLIVDGVEATGAGVSPSAIQEVKINQNPYSAEFARPGRGRILRWSHDFFLMPAKKDKGPVATVGVDAFNALNTVNDVSYVGNLSSPFFGHAVAARPPRRLQLSMRFRF